MKFKFLNSNITVSIILGIVLILLVYSVFVTFVFIDMRRTVEQNSDEFKRAKEKNLNYSKLLYLKRELLGAVKDVNHASNMLFDGTHNSEEINKIWQEKIDPVMDSLVVLTGTGFDDDTRKRFNKMYELIEEVETSHRQVLLQGTPQPALGDKMSKLSKDFDDFLRAESGITYVDPKRIELFSDGVETLIFILLVAIATIIVVINILISIIKTPLKSIDRYLMELKNGNLPEAPLTVENDDLKGISRSLNYVNKKLQAIKKFAVRVGEGNFEIDGSNYFEREGVLGNSLVEMQASLRRVAEDDKQRNHINEGLANFSEILGNYTNDLNKFGDEVIKNLVNFLGANQGGLFVVNDDDDSNPYLELVSCFAYDKKKHMGKKIIKGQGLIGQSWQEGSRIYMTDVPEGYVSITSGLGESTPRCILIIPLIFNEEIHGVIELASFKILQDYELGFVEKVSESISSALSSVKVNTRTQTLLSQSEGLTDKMKVQEEEMMRNVQELKVTQEESQRREEQHLREIRRLKRRLEEYERNF